MAETMQEFQWKGINKGGRRVTGIITATGVKTAESELTNRQIEVISIKRKKVEMRFGFWQKKIKSKDIVFFTRYLSTMLTAGMPILKALDIIAQEPENKIMQAIVQSIRNQISTGKTLADSFSQYPQYFDELYCNLVRAGEKSGTLDKILNRLATYLEKTEGLKRKIKKAFIYPAAIVSVALIVGFILLVFVMPQFANMFKSYGMKLPLFTQLVISVSNFTRSYWWLLLILGVGAFWGARSLIRKNERSRYIFDEKVIHFYILGPMIQKAIIARFTSTLAITIDAGLPIIESMKSMVHIMGNKVYSEAIEKICNDITEGNALSSAMKNTALFPNMVIQMVSVGEASGTLSEMLNNVARYYEEEVNAIVDNLSALLEPIIIVVLGAIIGSFVIAMYLPIFKLGSLF